MTGLPQGFDWEDLLRAAAALQQMLPDAVLLGGTAAALHLGHRFSRDADFALGDLQTRFDELLALLEAREDWETARVQPPYLILGSLKGVETGLRQLRRQRPLETTTVATKWGPIRVPTVEELLRVKCWLVLSRNQTRDYVDAAALSAALQLPASVSALHPFDDYYRDLYKPSARRDVSPLLQLARQLAAPSPEDHDVDLAVYKGLREEWRSWDAVRRQCEQLAVAIIAARVPGPGETPG